MDTNNLTESFNNVRYLPLRHDTTIHALVQVLLEVAFPEQEIRYIQATIKQTGAYRKPRYEIPPFLQDRPQSIKGVDPFLLVISPNRNHFHQVNSNSREHAVKEMTHGKLTYVMVHARAHPFNLHIFHASTFAILQHYPQWSWESLPKDLTESVHMTLDNPVCKDDQEVSNHDDHDLNILVEESQTIPVHSTPGAQVYRLQKQIEEALGRCRSLAFLTNDATCLQQALTQCKVVMDTLISSATEISEPHAYSFSVSLYCSNWCGRVQLEIPPKPCTERV